MTTMRVCLVMVVKNHAADVEASLQAVAKYIDCWMIGDLGSTDGTLNIIQKFFFSHGIPGKTIKISADSIGRARDTMLDIANSSALNFDYILLTDGEERIEIGDNFDRNLTSDIYLVRHGPSASDWKGSILKRGTNLRRVEGERERFVAAGTSVRQLDDIRVTRLATDPNISTARSICDSAIPKVFHFITGLDPNFGGKPFSFAHAMAVVSESVREFRRCNLCDVAAS